MTTQTQNTLPDINGRVSRDRVYFGLMIATIGFIVFIFGAKPDWFGLDRSPVIGFVQITVFLIGLGLLCLGGYLGLAALWAGEEKSIAADIGLRLIGTGYVIAIFTGMADIFGMSVVNTPRVPFFGPWQAAGVQVGMGIIALGMILIVPGKYPRNTSG